MFSIQNSTRVKAEGSVKNDHSRMPQPMPIHNTVIALNFNAQVE
jgi:hypothetical protein